MSAQASKNRECRLWAKCFCLPSYLLPGVTIRDRPAKCPCGNKGGRTLIFNFLLSPPGPKAFKSPQGGSFQSLLDGQNLPPPRKRKSGCFAPGLSDQLWPGKGMGRGFLASVQLIILVAFRPAQLAGDSRRTEKAKGKTLRMLRQGWPRTVAKGGGLRFMQGIRSDGWNQPRRKD